jgi:hypothetical protein
MLARSGLARPLQAVWKLEHETSLTRFVRGAAEGDQHRHKEREARYRRASAVRNDKSLLPRGAGSDMDTNVQSSLASLRRRNFGVKRAKEREET